MITSPRNLGKNALEVWKTDKFQSMASQFQDDHTKLLTVANLADVVSQLNEVTSLIEGETFELLNEQGNINAPFRHQQSLRKEAETLFKRLEKSYIKGIGEEETELTGDDRPFE